VDTRIAVVANAYPEYLLKESDVFRMNSLETLISPLLQKDIRIDFWGNHWDSMNFFIKRRIPEHWLHGYLDYTQAYKVYSSAKIVIGLQNCTDQLTQRTYEVLGSGGFLLTSNTPAVKGKFIPDRHLIVSSSPEETINKVKYYLSHHEERELILENAQKAIHNESYMHRAEQMLEVLDNQGELRNSISSGQGKVISYPKFIKKNYEVHVAKPGETLLHISNIYGVSPKHIMNLNHFESDFIYAGDLLKIKEKQRNH
jgi:spore maturation protein CgeB